MSEVLTALKGSLFVQATPGKVSEYAACVDVDDIADPREGSEQVLCNDRNGNFVAVGARRTPPDAPTTSITALIFPELDVWDNIGNCEQGLIITQDGCGKKGTLVNYDRYWIFHNARMTTQTLSNLVKRVEDAESTRKLDFTGRIPVYGGRKMTVVRQTIAETAGLNDIAGCGGEQCSGDCGNAQGVCDDLLITSDALTGSPTNLADVWSTSDGGGAWAAAAAKPFAAGEDILAGACFPIDRDTTRWLVTREHDAGNPMEVAYSDDGGATWTLVTVGSTNGENVTGPHGLFYFDYQHIWIATDQGNVYFSEDGGLTWDLQDSVTASGGLALNWIRFSDYSNGFAGGSTGTLIRTTDGGATWSDSPVDPSSGANLLCGWVFSKYRVIVGDDAGYLWQSWDAGLTWEGPTFTGVGTGDVKDVAFANDYEGFMLHDTAAPIGWMHKTFDGGHTWERLSTPTNAGMEALHVCNGMLAYAVGNVYGGTGVVLKASG